MTNGNDRIYSDDIKNKQNNEATDDSDPDAESSTEEGDAKSADITRANGVRSYLRQC